MPRMILSLFVGLAGVGPVWSQEPVVWVDVYIPRDTTPGEYSAMITVMADGARLSPVPLTVRVEPFTLPDSRINSLCVPFAYRTEPEKCRAYLRDMAGYLRSKGWLDLAYIYMEDEPNDAEQYETVRQQGELIRESGIKRLCTEQTVSSKPEWGTLYGAVDIWCPLWCLYDETTARQRQRLGEEIWTYTALCQGNGKSPFWQIDFLPVQFRAPFWVSWRYGVKGFLYWSSIYWTEGQDPWTTPHFRGQYWGEGMLLYPGKDAGLSGPAPSIRLKLIREALEDFEYMTLAGQQGHQAQVDEIVGSLAQSFNDWSASPDAYLAARAKIAALIAAE